MSNPKVPKNAANVYEFSAKNLDGEDVSLEKYRGKVLLIVNTATNCGLTRKNISELNEIYEKHKNDQFQILGFPSNQFKQELTCDVDIKEFLTKNNIQFDYFGKVAVNGSDCHPLFEYLKFKSPGTMFNFIKWNYTKFLVDKNGIPVKRYAPTFGPADIENDIQNLLNSTE